MEKVPVLWLNEFRILMNYRAFFPHDQLEPLAFLANHLETASRQDDFLRFMVADGAWQVDESEVLKQQVVFYPHWAGHRGLQMMALQEGVKMTLLIDEESAVQGQKFRWDAFFAQLGDVEFIVAERRMAIREIYQAVARGRTIAISMDGNRGSSERYIEAPFSERAHFQMRSGGVRLACKLGLPVTYASATLDGKNPKLTVRALNAESPEQLVASAVEAFRLDLESAPYAWKLWQRANRDHRLSFPQPGGQFGVRYGDERFVGDVGTGRLIPLTSPDSIEELNGREYLPLSQCQKLAEMARKSA
ncbi:MAG: hypothetical protein H6510_02730 [Acidobacteria bacterium]|nr:hypothetical protein [Acidobacteriota bacterium]MCB9396711.1 hypothetical protein [Acidobacteriota bacterium]